MTDRETYRARLAEERAQVTAELKDLGIHNPEVPEDWIATPADTMDAEADPNVAADRVESWDERRATLAVLETRYNNIARAEQKLEDGTYGSCEICGKEIEADRLNANPAARTCIEHKDEAMSR